MSKAGKFIAFALGAAIGSVTTWYFVKTKYEQIAQDEIDSVKEVFSKKTSSTPVDIHENKEKAAEEAKEDMMAYSKKLSSLNYTDYTNVEMPLPDVETKNVEVVEQINDIYVIPPEDFGELYGYDEISLTLYSDNVLANDFDEQVEDIDGKVGSDYMNHFGEYEEDSVYIRNERLKCDFEILMDLRKYSDVLKTKPRGTGEIYD